MAAGLRVDGVACRATEEIMLLLRIIGAVIVCSAGFAGLVEAIRKEEGLSGACWREGLVFAAIFGLGLYLIGEAMLKALPKGGP